MAGGARYPYPKEVWSPAGGWWTRPSNWKTNTAIVGFAMIGITYITWKATAPLEKPFRQSTKPPA